MHCRHLVLPLVAAACSFPSHVASKTVEFTLPASGVHSLLCESHNGDITVVGDAAATEIALRAEISIRAPSQAEADATLHTMDVVREVEDGQLRVHGRHPEPLVGMSATFAFTLRVPHRLAVQLDSHNGDLVVRGTEGPLRLDTHNGSIEASVVAPSVTTTTHNGDTHVHLGGQGPVDGTVESHNGDIVLDLAAGLGTTLDATTHNGKVVGPDQPVDATWSGKRRLRCRIGDGKGNLTVATHNGDVQVR